MKALTMMWLTLLALSLPSLAPADTVTVAAGDAQDLYAKLADPATAGHTLLLSGSYRLTAEGNGAATAGYLELGNRHLRGEIVMITDADGLPVAVDPATDTVLDGSALVPMSDPVAVSEGLPAFSRTRAMIRAPEGNAIERVTVIWPAPGSFGPGGAIRLLSGTGGRVASCQVMASNIGIFVNNACLLYTSDAADEL